MKAQASAALWSALAISSGARAVDVAPRAAATAEVAKHGTSAAAARQGYRLKDYLAYAVRDARNIDPSDGEVDAVVIATPLERTRHAAYVAAYSGQPIDGAEARRRSGLRDGMVDVLIFAHGDDGEDQKFGTRFGPASITFAGRSLVAEATSGKPSKSVYPLVTGDRFRFVTTVRYRFDLSQIPGANTEKVQLHFTDGSGKDFHLPVDLGQFQ